MKTRILYTKVWQDELVTELSPTQKLLFIYYLTNDNIGLTGMYELTDRQTAFDTGLTQSQIADGKEKFEKAGKIFFYKNWVYVVNSQRLNGFHGEKLEKAIKKELNLINVDIASYFNRVSKKEDGVSPIVDRSINHKSEIINHKEETIIEKLYSSINYLRQLPETDLQEFIITYQASTTQVKEKAESLANYCEGHGRKYKNYRAMLQNALQKDFGKRKPQTQVNVVTPKELSPEQRARNLELSKQIKDNFKFKN